MGRKGQSITLSISDRDKTQLEQIAIEQGMKWGDRPNISRLVEAIARRELLIGRNNDWSESRIKALQQSIQALLDAGHPESAQMIAELLLERSELSIPVRSQLERDLETSIEPWRQTLDQFIRQQQPFQLSYRDAADRLLTFTIHHARIVPYEKRLYLDCWCQETDSNQDIPELNHNWSLRLDRIAEAAIYPTAKGKWHADLDRVDVELHLMGGLAYGYQAKPDDRINEWHPEQNQVRRVIQRISNTFWFLREILCYGDDCVVMGPESVRQMMQAKVQSMIKFYAVPGETTETDSP
jgi:predicted DNA-binding transcriptional regulator YafY